MDKEAPPSLKQIGQYTSAIATSLRDTEMRYDDGLYANAPQVLRDHLGPPMAELPSFSKGDIPMRKPWGVGIFFDKTHAAMRVMGKHMGSLMSGMDEKAHAGQPFLAARTSVAGSADQALGSKTVSFNEEARRKGVDFSAIARHFIVRPFEEQEVLEKSVGNAEKLFNSMLTALGQIEDKLGAMPEAEKEQALRKAGITLDRERVGQWLYEAQPHLSKLANFFILTHGITTPKPVKEGAFEALMEVAGRDPDRILIRSRDDAAIAAYSLFIRLIKQDITDLKQAEAMGMLCDELAKPKPRNIRDGNRQPVNARALGKLSAWLHDWQGSGKPMDDLSKQACNALADYVAKEVASGPGRSGRK